jgi:hypothetical protein
MQDETFTHHGPGRWSVPDSKRRRALALATVAAVLFGLAVLASACSSGPASPGVAGSGTTATTGSSSNAAASQSDPSQSAAMLAYSECMQSHGVPNFPDPNSQGQILIQGGSGSGLDPNSPTFQAAQKACQSKMPAPTPAQQAQALKNALKVSQCMRAHGIKDFPDPTSQGGRIQMQIHSSPGSDLNPNDPLFQAAQKACMPNAPKLNTSGSGSGGSFSGAGS